MEYKERILSHGALGSSQLYRSTNVCRSEALRATWTLGYLKSIFRFRSSHLCSGITKSSEQQLNITKLLLFVVRGYYFISNLQGSPWINGFWTLLTWPFKSRRIVSDCAMWWRPCQRTIHRIPCGFSKWTMIRRIQESWLFCWGEISKQLDFVRFAMKQVFQMNSNCYWWAFEAKSLLFHE